MKKLTYLFWKTVFPALLLLLTTNALIAATCTFTNGSGDNLWSNSANWSTPFSPSTADDAIISSGTLTVDVDIDVKSLAISGTASVTFSHTGTAYIGNFTISGGSVSSTNKIIISNGLNWTGTSSLTSSTAIELSAASTSTISGSGNRSLYGSLINYGTVTHTGGSLRFFTNGSLENNGTYTVDGADFMIDVGGSGITNNGIFNKNNTLDLNVFAVFNQGGTGILNINKGTFKLLATGSYKGSSTINIAENATLNINTGTYTFESGTNINGDGTVEVSGGIATLEGTINPGGRINISGGVVNFNNATPSSIAFIHLSGGTLQGNGQIIITNELNWNGTSTIQNTDTIKLASTTTSYIYSGGSKNLYTPIVNDGTISHTQGNFRFYPGGSLVNNGTYLLNGPNEVFDNGGGAFENNGTFNHQSTSTATISPDFNNNASGRVKGKGTVHFNNLTNLGIFSVDATSGTLNLGGSFVIGSALEIGFNNANHGDVVVANNVLLSGALNVDITGSIPVGTYPILSTTSGVISGTFDSDNIPPNFSIIYGASEVNLQVGLLPVELIRFTANAKNKEVMLEWQTASERNSDKFIIEHSQDGQSFVAVGTVKAAGTSDEQIDYHFIHEAPVNGANYYRLRQEDLDDKFEYSKVRVLNFYDFDKDLSLYPNPTHGTVIIKNQSDKVFNLTIRDLSGKVVYIKKDVNPGAVSLDLTSLPKSMYTLEFSDDAYFSLQEKLMILE